MAARDPEYDHFGPWALQISDRDPVPPIFRPHLVADEAPLFSLKIPRAIERRNAHPGMHLYDYLVVLNKEHLRVLTREGEVVRSSVFRYGDIQAIVYAEELLAGNLRLVLPGETFDLPFNTVSSQLMDRVVKLIRGRYSSNDPVVDETGEQDAFAAGGISDEDLSFYFAGLINELRTQSPGLRVLASQPNVAVGRIQDRGFRRLFFGLIGKTLLESLHMIHGSELRIVSRGRAFRYRGASVYGRHTCYLPIGNILGATWEPSDRDSAITRLILAVHGGEFSFHFVRDNPMVPVYADLLSRSIDSSRGQ